MSVNAYAYEFRGAKIWNSLDTDLKEHKSLKNFKLALKSRLFSNLYKYISIVVLAGCIS